MLSNATLVVADDEPIMRQLLARSLGSQGFRVLLAESGRRAFEPISQNKVALVLADIHMPDGGGIELIETLQKSQYKDMPIILMTGDLDFVDRKLKGTTILRKPFSRTELMEMIQSILKS